ncbi:MAG: hypothetical protein ACXW2G_11825 [Burkholderiaceae bacterium]
MTRWLTALLTLLTASGIVAQSGPAGGNLYVAGGGFDFAATGERALAQNPASRFFLLAVGDAIRYLSLTAPPELVEVRRRVARGNVQFLVCERDLQSGEIRLGDLAPGTVAVRGFPPPGSTALPVENKFYADEDPANLPWSTETLRRLRATCS